MDMYETETALREIEDKQYRYQLLIKSLEAKVERIEPNSVEFENTVAAIFEAKNKIKALESDRTALAREGNIFNNK